MNEEDLRDEIKKIEIPKELNSVVQGAIKAGIEKKRKRKQTIKRMALACTLLFVIISAVIIGALRRIPNEIIVEGFELPTVNNELRLHALIDKEMATKKEDSENSSIVGTNNQLEGIDEVDTIKTDGKYIFSALYEDDGRKTIRIFNGENPKDVKFVKDFKVNGQIQGIFAKDGKLVVISALERENNISIYNYKDINNITLENQINTNGYNYTARLINDELVLIQLNYVDGAVNVKEHIPYIEKKGVKDIKELDNIKYCSSELSDAFLTIIKFNINSFERIESESLLVRFDNVFISADNIYITNYNYEEDKSTILKFSLKEGGKVVAKGEVPGVSLNQFSLDEYNGNLRIATTTNLGKDNSESHVFILDKNLDNLGGVSALGGGEVIHSVRFMGDRGYVVTFKSTDPLYIIDLKDVKNPTVIGEIKVPGVSKYLHPFDDNTLIGFGEDRGENNYEGIKLSLFSVENGGSELFNEKIKNGYSNATYDHKYFFFDKESSLVGFDLFYQTYNKDEFYMVAYKVSKEKGFEKVISEKIDSLQDGRIFASHKGIYFILGDRVVVYDSKTFEKLSESSS
ncbi:MAG: beta-propeller domain-containing protein [Clostridium sp.]